MQVKFFFVCFFSLFFTEVSGQHLIKQLLVKEIKIRNGSVNPPKGNINKVVYKSFSNIRPNLDFDLSLLDYSQGFYSSTTFFYNEDSKIDSCNNYYNRKVEKTGEFFSGKSSTRWEYNGENIKRVITESDSTFHKKELFYNYNRDGQLIELELETTRIDDKFDFKIEKIEYLKSDIKTLLYLDLGNTKKNPSESIFDKNGNLVFSTYDGVHSKITNEYFYNDKGKIDFAINMSNNNPSNGGYTDYLYKDGILYKKLYYTLSSEIKNGIFKYKKGKLKWFHTYKEVKEGNYFYQTHSFKKIGEPLKLNYEIILDEKRNMIVRRSFFNKRSTLELWNITYNK